MTSRGERRAVLGECLRSLGLEAGILSRRPELLFQQLYNRLQWFKGEIHSLADEARQGHSRAGKAFFHQYRVPKAEMSRLLRTMTGHAHEVCSCSWSPDGRWIASTGADRTARVWDADDGRELFSLQCSPCCGAASCLWSPDGRQIALAGMGGNQTILWNPISGCRIDLPGGRPAWSASGRFIAIAGATTGLWDVGAGMGPDSARMTLALPRSDQLGWSAGQDRLALLRCGGVTVLDAETGERIELHREDPLSLAAFAWSPDGRFVAACASDRTVRVWDARSGREERRLSGHTGEVSCCSWAPDGRSIVSAGAEALAILWDAQSGSKLLSWPVPEASHNVCAWSPEGDAILFSAGGRFAAYDAATGREWRSGYGHDPAWSPDGGKIAWRSLDCLGMADTGGEERPAVLRGHAGSVAAFAWSPDGERIASAGRDKSLRVWDAEDEYPSFSMKVFPHDGDSCCDWAPGGDVVAVAGMYKDLLLLDGQSGRFLKTRLQGHGGGITGCSWSADGKRLLTGSWDKTLRIWGERNLKLEGHAGTVIGCSWSPDARRILSVGDDGQVKLWNGESGGEILSMTWRRCAPDAPGRESRGMCATGWSPDGRLFAFGDSSYALRVISADTGSEISALRGHGGWITSCSWSPDGGRIVTSGSDAGLKVWQPESGRELMTLAGHGGLVTAASWSPDGGRIVSASWDGTIRIWDGETGTLLATLTGHEGKVVGCGFLPGGGRIWSSGNDRSLRVWDARENEERLCFFVTGDVVKVAASPAGDQLAFADLHGNVYLLAIVAGALVDGP